MATSDAQRRRLGTIIDVSAERFRVEMAESADGYTLVGFDGQHYVARIGSLVLIPLTNSYVVAEVTGLQERPDPSAISSASKSLDDVMHASSRQLTLAPLGTLPFDETHGFSFGVSVFPPLYADVLHVENRDLDRILNVVNQEVEIANTTPPATKLNTLTVGTSAVFNDYDVKVRINEFFGAHSAILGNTGSGKSCTISSLLQEALGKTSLAPAGGSTFVLFDTNGEYRRAVSKIPAPIQRTYARIEHAHAPALFPATPYDDREQLDSFVLPHWLLSLEEWELLLQASDRVQRPILRTALGLTSLFASESADQLAALRDHILASCLLFLLMDSENATAANSRIGGLLNVYELSAVPAHEITSRLTVSYGSFDQRGLKQVEAELKGLLIPNAEIPSYENHPFRFSDLTTALEIAILYEESHGNRRVRDNCSTLLTRVKSLGMRDEFSFLRSDPYASRANSITSESFTDAILGIDRDSSCPAKQSQVYVLDLSAVGDEVVEVVSSVITRLLFDRLRQSDVRNSFPVNLILEEAHRYVPRQSVPASTLDATRIFERVAKEGRKYGLFLMLSSQRPSELSGTVLSQCSNYVVHRIQNPEDLQHIRRMTPFISESVLNRLASLPKQFALVFGTSVSIPTTFKVRTAAPLPQSDDSDVSLYWYQSPEKVTDIPL
ncbi:hypothetical protein HMPREF0183_0269 [Brevibacterium mcbrellneri ATCC 49030]|uniref:Helicase HerA central domain-containing protein n=1 Tax=Brevibacterium mcbrellneri ATCC 49030 TaxID=585530 RepID=D4YK09_9MICO|nr:ATP-binding protein [Brevibacterium mcbrellneri]EFG48453.1 hypothetical protein HMPREF0183_0269 [Brevibacterium mcbrellneri ATCC 49030]